MSTPETAVRFSQGSRLGPYVLVQLLGRGGFGEVWLADRVGGIATTRLALKLPLDHKVDLEAIRQEATLWVRAGNHPNVLPLFEADIYDGQVVLASEYAPDGSLSAWLDRSGGFAPSIQAGIQMALGILTGLQHLHTCNIIHRDLKPANVLMQGEIPRLADFGIARLLTVDAQTNRSAGTPAYMAPEAFDGKRSCQTDIWSAGVILFQLLTGTLPFAENDLMSLMHSIMSKEPATLPRSIPRPIQDVVARSLQKDLAQRYSTASQMRHDLQMALRQTEQASHPSARESSGSQLRSIGGNSESVSLRSEQSGLSRNETRDQPALSSEAPQLEIANGRAEGTTYRLEKERIVIGRNPDCDISFHGIALSVNRYHAQLVWTGHGYAIEDLQSCNGTYVNGRIVRDRVPLQDNDRIHVGGMILIYRNCLAGLFTTCTLFRAIPVA
jgi:serine/threonine-protein kinase